MPVETGSPDDGDLVSVRIQRLEEEEGEPRPYEFVLGRDQAIPDVENSIRTLDVGGSGEFTVQFPEAAEGDQPREVEQELKITLEGRKRLELPELDDALASAAGDFETLDELVEKVREDLSKEAERESETEIRGALMEQILSANPFEIPESMVDQYVRSALGDPNDLPDEQFAEAKEQLPAEGNPHCQASHRHQPRSGRIKSSLPRAKRWTPASKRSLKGRMRRSPRFTRACRSPDSSTTLKGRSRNGRSSSSYKSSLKSWSRHRTPARTRIRNPDRTQCLSTLRMLSSAQAAGSGVTTSSLASSWIASSSSGARSMTR